MLNRFSIIFILTIFCLISSFGFSKIIFNVPKEIFSEDRTFSLKDLFEDIDYDRSIRYITGDSITYTKEELAKILNGLLNSYYNDFELSFESEQIRIIYNNTQTNNKNNIDLLSLIEESIKEYDPELIIKNIDLKNASNTVTEAEITRITSSNDKLYISLYITEEDNKKRYLSVTAEVAKFEKALIYSKDTKRGTILNETLTEEATINSLTTKYSPIDIQLLKKGKYELSKDVKAGEILDSRYLKRIPDIKSGDILTIIVEYEGIRVTSIARALTNGNYGEIISVRNTETAQIISGKLIEGPAVLVKIGG
ncbi:MAG: flagellar basal body P-ring formation chaperone FlgA [Defluviitoga tunisiensis]|jgi:flagella basal body P-ring formation protein FlgA|nr:flagellar basal body P-ring formation chaperone FlgA [Defluviitoga tunisiensis]MDY0378939.1 flagellar basal body P-ring formation chaperone FlgA [Defluviitoga tunisiensis]HHV01621.1 flagellar basal body P-ring formation protein FlgA [Defluviitoga tunisiensis]HOB55477.1 flagellar basal body P-ring formation chaperone FlgA [Defluviitoga tunisiensis]HOK16131.1 flagellar basal body P-ring formation chaperone FlgA [Defluviitoga tunisiensis]